MDYPVRRIIMRSVDLSMLRHVSKGLTDSEFSLTSEIDVIAYKPYMYMYVV